MRFVGIDVAAECHVVAVVNESERVICKPTAFGEDGAGYEELFRLLGSPDECFGCPRSDWALLAQSVSRDDHARIQSCGA